MLKSLKINNFKSVHDLEIELGKVNVFIGENGCGKTTILEGLALGSAAISNKLEKEFLVSRGVRIIEGKLMKSAFNKDDADKDIQITLTNSEDDHLRYNINYSNKNLELIGTMSNLEEKALKLSKEMTEEIFHQINGNRKLYLAEDETLKQYIERYVNQFLKSNKINSNSSSSKNDHFNFYDFLIYTPENFFLRRFEEEGQISPIGIRGEGLFKHLVEKFKDKEFTEQLCANLKLMNWFEGIEIPSDLHFTESRINMVDKFIRDTTAYFDQRSANEGFLYLLFYFTLFLSDETPELFALDNFGNGLNPKLCRELTKRLIILCKTHGKQIILTTHNPAILDGLDLSIDEQRLFVIYRNSEGHTKAKRVRQPKEVEGIETVRFSEAFIRGYLGGLPKNF